MGPATPVKLSEKVVGCQANPLYMLQVFQGDTSFWPGYYTCIFSVLIRDHDWSRPIPTESSRPVLAEQG